MATPAPEIGKRLLATQIDRLAQYEPQKTWATIPRHPGDVSIGYRDISYKQFANAINHAAVWLNSNLSGTKGDLETFTYNGPFDVQYAILAVAAAKCGKRFLLISPWSTPAVQTYLLGQTKCTTYLYSPFFAARVQPVLDAAPWVRPLEAPKLSDWLDGGEASPFPYERSWDEAATEPWLLFHTSGTTGLPKIIPYTHESLATFDAAQLMPDVSEDDRMVRHFKNQRFFTTVPPCHTMGMTAALQWTVFLDNVFVVGPSAGPVTPQQAMQVIKIGKVDGLVINPSPIEEMCRLPGGLDALHSLEWISYIGAPLPKHVAVQLNEHSIVMPGMGTTEAGSYFTTAVSGPDGWECYRFRPGNGIVMEPREGDMYELVFHRKPEYERWQQIFKIFPHLDVVPTKDLWTRHPSVPDAWRYAGRLDDVVVLAHGSKIMATDLQSQIREAPGVRSALVGGERRLETFLMIDLVDQKPLSDEEKEAKISEIWPFVERLNEQCFERCRFARDLIMLTDPSKPLPLTLKGDIVRWRALDLYGAEIDQLYAAHDARKASASLSADSKPVVVETVTPVAVLAEQE